MRRPKGMISVVTRGAEDIRRRLASMPREVSGANLLAVAMQGAEVVRQEEVANALKHKRTGTLASDIHAEPDLGRGPAGTRVVVRIGPGERGWYGRLLEFGHAIVPPGRRREHRAAKKLGQQPAKVVPPYPWLRPALDAKRAEVQSLMAAELRRRLGL